MRTRLRSVVAVVALLLSFSPAEAASVSVYTNRSDWVTATPNAATIGFEGLAPAFGSIFVPTPPGTNLSNVNFTIDHASNNGSLYVYGPGFPYAGNSALSTASSDSGPNNILVTLPAGVSSVGLDFGNIGGAPGNSVRFRLSSGEIFTGITGGYDGPSGPRWFNFIGFKSDQPINTLLIEYPKAHQSTSTTSPMLSLAANCSTMATLKSLATAYRKGGSILGSPATPSLLSRP